MLRESTRAIVVSLLPSTKVNNTVDSNQRNKPSVTIIITNVTSPLGRPPVRSIFGRVTMGRYTTVQAYSDNNPKVATITYAQATGSGGSAGGGDAKEAEKDKEKKEKYSVERVQNVSGSTAGAGSGEFHDYRAARRREYFRMASIEAGADKQKKDDLFIANMILNKQECELKTAKRSEKRRRKKKLAAKKGKKSTTSNNNDSDSPVSDSEFNYIPISVEGKEGSAGTQGKNGATDAVTTASPNKKRGRNEE